MRPVYGDDYAISCCVSAMRIGKQMQFFGARCNLPKVILLALNGGEDETTGEQIGPFMKPVEGDVLNYDEVVERYKVYRDWVCKLYVNTMNVIHYMHDKYAYEKVQMALYDTKVERFMAFGIAGLSVAADSMSALKFGKVRAVRDERGVITEFKVEGSFPKFGNNDERADSIAKQLVEHFITGLEKIQCYRSAKHTLSILTITSNLVYGKKTGATPDGRPQGEPFAPSANPMHNRDTNQALASLTSVPKIKSFLTNRILAQEAELHFQAANLKEQLISWHIFQKKSTGSSTAGYTPWKTLPSLIKQKWTTCNRYYFLSPCGSLSDEKELMSCDGQCPRGLR